MAKFEILSKNVADTATLSGGGWVTSLSLLNLQNKQYHKRARSLSLNASDTQLIAVFAKAELINVVGLRSHNGSNGGRIKVTASNNSDFSSPLLVKEQDIWKPWFFPTDRPIESENWLSGKPTDAEKEIYPSIFLYKLDSLIKAQYWKFEIIDPDNTKGYFESGRLFMGVSWSLPIDMIDPPTITPVEVIKSDSSIGGQEYIQSFYKYRLLSFTLLGTKSDIFKKFNDMQMNIGVLDEILVIPDPDDDQNEIREVFIGRIKELSELTPLTKQSHYTTKVTIKELL